MAFPLEPVRSNIYAPIRKFFVNDTDWPFVLIFAFISFFIPYYYRWTIFHIPISPFTGLGGLCAAYSFFVWTVQGKRPRWLKHYLRSKMEKSYRGRALASDLATKYNKAPFLLDAENLEALYD